MSNISQQSQKRLHFGYPAIYSIQVIGRLEKSWSKRLSDLTIQAEDTIHTEEVVLTTLTGKLVDQAALMGVLNALYNLRLPIWSVECLGAPTE